MAQLPNTAHALVMRRPTMAELIGAQIENVRTAFLKRVADALSSPRALLDEIEEIVSRPRPRARPEQILATVLFTDIVGSTLRVAKLGDRRWRQILAAHDLSVRSHVAEHGGQVLKSLGDGYLATFDRPARAIRCARAMRDEARSLGLQVKAGIHTGECELLDGDIAGLAVHIGARVMTMASPGEVLATQVVRDLVVGSGIEFAERGKHELRGVPGIWTLHAVTRSQTL
jgi:class 3 adenylate cyclase